MDRTNAPIGPHGAGGQALETSSPSSNALLRAALARDLDARLHEAPVVEGLAVEDGDRVVAGDAILHDERRDRRPRGGVNRMSWPTQRPTMTSRSVPTSFRIRACATGLQAGSKVPGRTFSAL